MQLPVVVEDFFFCVVSHAVEQPILDHVQHHENCHRPAPGQPDVQLPRSAVRRDRRMEPRPTGRCSVREVLIALFEVDTRWWFFTPRSGELGGETPLRPPSVRTLTNESGRYCMSSGSPANQPVDGSNLEIELETPSAPVGSDGPRPVTTLLDHVVHATSLRQATGETPPAATGVLERFLTEKSPSRSLAMWMGSDIPEAKSQLIRKLGRDIARIDQLLCDQLNAVLHHPDFQQLEASWRGLRSLVDEIEEGANIKVRMLSASWRDVSRDLERAIDFDQSQLFKKIYSDEFGSPGGEPFGVLIGDYEMHATPGAGHPTDDMATLAGISQVAAAAFAPFITGTSPSMFGLQDFGGLERPINLERVFDQKEYIPWKSLRKQEDSRFIGLTMPHVLRRLPYEDDGSRGESFRFQENVAGPDRSKYLWGNAAYAFGTVLLRAFTESGWLADIRGVQRGIEGGGLVTNLPAHSFSTDKRDLLPKTSSDVVITDALEKSLNDLGFIPLCHCKDTEYSAFYSNGSVQKPKKYDRMPATINARMSAMLQYMLCVSRFSHYIKVLARDKIGSFATADDCERYLSNWIGEYISPDQDASLAVKCRRPLREANIEVREHPGKPGHFECVVRLWPHYELDDLTAAVRLRSELAPIKG